MRRKTTTVIQNWIVAMLVGLICIVMATSVNAAEKKLKVFVSFGYYGNAWMEQNRNMMTALSRSKDYKDKFDLEVQIVGNADAQRQAQQINAMVEAGADIILLYPVSPTALNRSIRNACKQGVSVFTWDATVTEECATCVHADNVANGIHEAWWVVTKLEGKGNVLMVNGVNGIDNNEDRVKAAKAIFDMYPDIHVVGEVEGMWSDPVVRENVSKFMAVRSWDDIDIAFTQLGCYPFYSLQDEAGIPDDKKIPCAGSAENSERLSLLPVGTKVPGASGTYRPMGIDGYTFDIGPIMGVKALWYAVNARLKGEKLPHEVFMPIPVVTRENIKMCEEGTWEEMNDGCNAFPPTMVKNPELSAAVYDKEIPQVAMKASLTGEPEY